jgi:hypothetical protein
MNKAVDSIQTIAKCHSNTSPENIAIKHLKELPNFQSLFLVAMCTLVHEKGLSLEKPERG